MSTTSLRSPFLRKAELLPTPGGGVGGFDKSYLYDDPEYASRQHHAEPTADVPYNKPFGEKGTEPERTKHGSKAANIDDRKSTCVCVGFRPTKADPSMCLCGHLFHEHWEKRPNMKLAAFKSSLLKFKMGYSGYLGGEMKDREDFRASLKVEWEDPDGYLYQALTYCPRCGRALIDELLDTRRVGPPGEEEDDSYLKDSDVVPQPLLALDEEAVCVKCGDPMGQEPIEPGEYTPEDMEWLHSMRIASLKLSSNPLLAPPDPETATFFKESEGDKPHCPHCGSTHYNLMPTDFETAKCSQCGRNWKHGIVRGINDPGPEKEWGEDINQMAMTATEKSYGTGTPVGGTDSGIPASKDPSQPRWTPAMPPAPPDLSPSSKVQPQPQPQPSATQEQQVKQVVNDVSMDNPQMNRAEVQDIAENVQEKMSALESVVKLHEDPDKLPPRTELRKHLDESLVDDSGMPPIPLHKGAAVDEDDEDEEDVTDLGTIYGKPLGKSNVPGALPPLHDQPGEKGAPGRPTEYDQGWAETCPLCGDVVYDWSPQSYGMPFESPDAARSALIEHHYPANHPGDIPPKYLDEEAPVPASPGKYDWAKGTPLENMVPPNKRFSPTRKDKELLKSMGIKSPKTTMDAERWWKSTVNTKRKEMADKLGIDVYWSHFVWDSLPMQVQEKVRQNLPNVMGPQLNLTPADKDFLGEMKIQAAAKDWNPLIAKKLYDEGVEAAQHGKVDEAKKAMSQSLVHNPYNGPAHFMLGIILAQEGDTDASLVELERALRSSPQDNLAYHSMVKKLQQEGSLDGIPQEVRNFLLDRMMSKEARTATDEERAKIRKTIDPTFPDAPKTAVQISDGFGLSCPNCKGQKTRPVDDPDAEGGNLMECEGCGAFFAK
jgi:hypothetical protein